MEEIGLPSSHAVSPFKNSCASEPHLAAGAREGPLLPFCASRLAAGGVWKIHETRGGSRAKKKMDIQAFHSVDHSVVLRTIDDVWPPGTLGFVAECQIRTLSFRECNQYLGLGLL